MLVGAFVLCSFLLCGETGDLGVNLFIPFVSVMARDGALAMLWWIAAVGIGLPLTRWMMRASPSMPSTARAEISASRSATEHTTLDQLAIAIALGSGLMLAADNFVGSVGLLTALGGGVAWTMILVGAALCVRELRDAPLLCRDAAFDESSSNSIAPPWFVFAALAAIAALLAVAASSSPGWLWSSEFGGYDALSYHLVLPKFWLETHAFVGPVAGNTYAYLPSFVESAFLHLMTLRGDAIDGAFACQWWSAIGALAAAFIVSRLARATICPRGAIVALMVFLAIPWITVVGTLAYNDILPCVSLAGAWLLLVRATQARATNESPRTLDTRAAIGLALIVAAAVGAKPTALLFVALPLLALTLQRAGVRALGHAPMVILVALVMLAPWLVRNALSTGNPVFPFLTAIFGLGDWSAAQVDVFTRAHGPAPPMMERFPLLLWEWLFHGLGQPSAQGEPWFPQWSVIPIVGIAGLMMAARKSRDARGALLMIVIACVGWLCATHLKSRFLLPTAVPLTLGTTWLLMRANARKHTVLPAVMATMLLAFPFVVFLREPVRGREMRSPSALLDATEMMTGRMLAQALSGATPEQRTEIMTQATTPFALNHLVPPNARILGIGFATPFYVQRPIETTVVWERGAFDVVAAQAPDDPASWGGQLRAQGFTHVVIDLTMLERWAASGWLNPQLASGAWLEVFLRSNTPLIRTVDNRVVVALTPPRVTQ